MSGQFLKNKLPFVLAIIVSVLIIFGSFSPIRAEETEQTIITGEAEAEAEILNVVNTDEVIITTDTENIIKIEEVTDEATSTEATTTDIILNNTNEATTTSSVVIEVASGENSASSTATTSITAIETGQVVALANITNVVNTNIYNSSGLILMLSNILGNAGDLDLRMYDFWNPPAILNINQASTSTCPTSPCGSLNLDIQNNNVASISNSSIIRVNSGGNSAQGNGSAIATGDVYAASNIINIVNSNIIDSNYMMLVFNNAGNWEDDFVFPAKDAFLDIFFKSNEISSTGSINIDNSNQANISNNIDLDASTGDNFASSTANLTVETGQGSVAANIINQVNTNIFNENSFIILFKIHGNWSGQVFGAPPGILWQETPQGVMLYADTDAFSNMSTDSAYNNLNMSDKNTADIKNDVQIFALTGQNKIEGESAEITTGNAYAASNIINVANTNVVGKNWILAIVNIFGDWNGNIAFGKPDLWVGISAETPRNPLNANDTATYKMTVINNGDAEANNTALTARLDDYLNILSVEGAAISTSGLTWDLGNMPAKDKKEITFTAAVKDNIPEGESNIENEATVSSLEDDQNNSDNTDSLSLIAYKTPRSGGRTYFITNSEPFGSAKTPPPEFKIKKWNNAPPSVKASSTISYSIEITNDGNGPAYDAVLIDILRDPNGKVIYQKNWPLDDILDREQIAVDYDVFFNSSSTAGVYINTAQIKALSERPWGAPYYGSYVLSNIATSSIIIEESADNSNSELSIDFVLPSITVPDILDSQEGRNASEGKKIILSFIPPTNLSGIDGGQASNMLFALDSYAARKIFPFLFILTLGVIIFVRVREGAIIDSPFLKFLKDHNFFLW